MMDLAVVGGGLAGTYVAHRISQLRPDWSVTLLESRDRVGGRLLSVRMPGTTDTVVELGGMRYRTSQKLMHALVQELSLNTQPFPVTHEDNRFLLRGVERRSSELARGDLPYRLEAPWKGLTPGEAIVAAFEHVVPDATKLDAQQWTRVRHEHRFEGRLLRDWALRQVLIRVLGREGYDYLVDGLGYTSIIGDWNAADAIPWFLIETRPDSENLTVADGMERVPRELTMRFQQTGGRVRLGFHLQSIEVDNEPGVNHSYRLISANRSRVDAKRVVLALPSSSLGSVAERSTPLNRAEIVDLIRSVTAHAMTKVFLWYPEAWWRHLGLRGRRTISDLRLRKTYFLENSAPGPALLLASYCDGLSVGYWRKFATPTRAPSDPDPYEGDDRWRRYSSPRELEEEAHRLVQTLHHHPNAPAPLGSAFMDWGVHPFGGAWHSWNPCAKSWEALSRLIKPDEHENIYICGEAFSNYQGWMEGALETAELVIEKLAKT